MTRHQDHLFALVYRLVPDRDQAADAVQEAFFSAYRNLASFRGGSVRSWLGRIAVNAAMDLQRARRRRPVQPYPEFEDESWQPPAEPEVEPESRALAAERSTALAAALDELPFEQRNCILLFDVEGYDYAEIAAIMRVEVGTVKSRIHRGRLALRSALAAGSGTVPWLRSSEERDGPNHSRAHSGHDELLIARLFGDDVDESERARALDQMADCPDCAALFADLGCHRRRDGSHARSAAAARLHSDRGRRRAGCAGRKVAVGRPCSDLRRSLGGALAALGLVGLVAERRRLALGAVSATQAPTSPDRSGGSQSGALRSGRALRPQRRRGHGCSSSGRPQAPRHRCCQRPPVRRHRIPRPSALARDRVGFCRSERRPGAVATKRRPRARVACSGANDAELALPSPDHGLAGRIRARHGRAVVWLAGFGVLFVLGLALFILPVRRRGAVEASRS